MFGMFDKKKDTCINNKDELSILIDNYSCSYSDKEKNKDIILNYLKKNNNLININKCLEEDISTISELINKDIVSFDEYKKDNLLSISQILAFENHNNEMIHKVFLFILKHGFYDGSFVFKEGKFLFLDNYEYYLKDTDFIKRYCLKDEYKIEIKINKNSILNLLIKFDNMLFLEFKNENNYKKINLRDIYEVYLEDSVLYINKENVAVFDFNIINSDFLFEILSSLSELSSKNLYNLKKEMINSNKNILNKIDMIDGKINNSSKSNVAGAGLLGLMIGISLS